MNKSRAIFLGSFNPPHKGHYDVVKSVIDSGIMNKLNIEAIHVIPCYQNPNKNKFTVSYMDRYKMTLYMFGDLISKGLVYIDDIEEEICPTYTYELIDHFNSGKDLYINKDNAGFWWIITVETIKELINKKWKNFKELLYKNNFIVVGKDEYEFNNLLVLHDLDKIICTRFVPLISTNDCHSTEIRNNFWVNAKYDSCITKDIKEYIIEHNLYK